MTSNLLMKIYHLISERKGGRLYECKYSYDGHYILLYIQLTNIPASAQVWKAVYLVVVQKPFDQIMKYNLSFKFKFLEQRFDFLFRNIKITKLPKRLTITKFGEGLCQTVSKPYCNFARTASTLKFSTDIFYSVWVLVCFPIFNSHTSVSFFCRW